ncbi:hypothetical protein GQX74_005776 [Glossina fuscipes]|nr:hypothetical protein GQX74_005776 [Glossina fuscipes]
MNIEHRRRVMSTTKLQTLTSAEENFLASLSTRKSVNNRKNASKLKLEKFTGCVSVVSTSIPGTTTQETIALNKNLNSSTPRNISNSMATSDKPNLGLEELQQLNVRSRFHIFEKAGHTDNRLVNVAMNGDDLIRGASITTKKKNLQEQGSRVIEEDFSNLARGSKNQGQDRVHESDIINESLTDNEKRRNIRTDLDDTINDLKTRFELGKGISKEERREERKQEIQNIRSRLFMGKQARIKEMYQQAVIESEHVPWGVLTIRELAEGKH